MRDLKILIIDDDEDDYFITSQYLEEITDFNVTCNWCFKIEEALIKLVRNNYDAYFIDYHLGAETGLEVLKEAITKGCVKPVILLTGKGNAQIDRLAVENGAYDYLIKGELTTEILERSLRYAIERFKLINDKTRAEQATLQKEKHEATCRLVKTLAHEIRNPLANINLSLDGIEEKNIDSQFFFIDIIKKSSSRINSIINELLQSLRAIELKLELVDIVEVVKDVIEIADDRVKLKNITVETFFPTHPIIKNVDVEKISISILNLILNAVEAMEADTGKLSVSIKQTLDSTKILIKDTGSGISDDNLKKLFEPYFTTKKHGMGLGLVSTLNIIKSHKADIKVESKENIGTTFIISFPS